MPVGRLDRNSEGLLLLTDDGELLYRLTHPAHEVEKCYLVTLRGAVEDSLIEALGGELFLDGEKLKPVGVRLLKREPEKTVLQMTLTEGKNRQIRRMCEQVGVEVIRLKRVSEGGIRLAAQERPLAADDCAGGCPSERDCGNPPFGNVQEVKKQRSFST